MAGLGTSYMQGCKVMLLRGNHQILSAFNEFISLHSEEEHIVPKVEEIPGYKQQMTSSPLCNDFVARMANGSWGHNSEELKGYRAGHQQYTVGWEEPAREVQTW